MKLNDDLRVAIESFRPFWERLLAEQSFASGVFSETFATRCGATPDEINNLARVMRTSVKEQRQTLSLDLIDRILTGAGKTHWASMLYVVDGKGEPLGKKKKPMPAKTSQNRWTKRRWSEDEIVCRIQEWVAIHGETPAIADWDPYKAREKDMVSKAARFEEADGYWPHAKRVQYIFGGWNAAIEAAGYIGRVPLRPYEGLALAA